MSKNIINTIGQHVFKYDPPQYTEKGAPVLAKNLITKESTKNVASEVVKKEEDKFQFLGEGYYFWDDNIKRAHKWGKQHCKGKYLILELPLELKGDRFLDLVGSREDCRIFYEAYKKKEKDTPGLKIGAFFHGIQTIAKNSHKPCPFSIVRALNLKSNAKKISFNHIIDSEMLLDPEIIICFYEKKELNLQSIQYKDKNDGVWVPTN